MFFYKFQDDPQVKAELKSEIKSEPVSPVKSEPSSTAAPAGDNDSKLMPPPPPALLRPKSPVKPVVRPLEAMRPEKYKNTDVRDLFPAFRENKVLRFSRLFPIKPANKPKTWRNLRRKFEKEAAAKGPEAVQAVRVGRDFSQPAFPEAPDDPAFYVEDQAVRFHRPAADKSEDVDEGQDGKKKADDHR